MGAVAGGVENEHNSDFGMSNGTQVAGLAGEIAKEIGIGIAIEVGFAGLQAGWTWATTPSAPPTYGNGNGATGGGYSGAGIGGNVSSGSTGSSHFG